MANATEISRNYTETLKKLNQPRLRAPATRSKWVLTGYMGYRLFPRHR